MPQAGQGGETGAGNLNPVQGQGGEPLNQVQRNMRYLIVGECRLADLKTEDILNDIAKRIQDGRRFIIPIGLPQAGKSMFIASLIAYAFRRETLQDDSCSFTSAVSPNLSTGVRNIIESLDYNRALPTTNKGFMTIIDLNMESNYREGTVKITLIDFSGEDIQSMINGKNSPDVDKVRNILNACVAQRSIFALLTPIDDTFVQLREVSDFDQQEATSMGNFIGLIRTQNPQLYAMTKFLIVVTKWDRIGSNNVSCSDFLKFHRNQLYNEYSNNNRSYGLLPYSVGYIQNNVIMKIDLQSARTFWHTLYRWCTGKDVLPWWKRLFS